VVGLNGRGARADRSLHQAYSSIIPRFSPIVTAWDRTVSAEPGDGLDAVQGRHLKIHQGSIRPVQPKLFDSVPARWWRFRPASCRIQH
jgi:hypothetical protein